MVLVEMNWNTIEYPAYSHPKNDPKITMMHTLNRKTWFQMLLLRLSEMYIAMKSVPPVEPSVRRAMTETKPYRKPPNMTFRNRSLKIGWK